MTIQDLKDKNLILFEVISGSKAFGLDTPTSDTDIRGVYFLPKSQFFGLDYIPQIANETNDEVYYELGRFVDLLYKNNPNILEMLATPEPCILYKHPVMAQLRLEDFLSKMCKDTFAGYAISQIKKARGLKKKIVNPMPETRKGILDFCYIFEGYEAILVEKWLKNKQINQKDCGLVDIPHSKGMYAMFHDSEHQLGYKGIVQKENANDIALSSIAKGEKVVAYLHFNKDAYSVYCKEYKEYWEWIEKRNDERYNTNQQHGKNYDSKNMMHTIRLLQTAVQILSKGTLDIQVPNRTELLAIKNGDLEYDDLLVLADKLIEEVEHFYSTSTLPDSPDKVKIEAILVEMRSEIYGSE
jgi:uncharacterized protein